MRQSMGVPADGRRPGRMIAAMMLSFASLTVGAVTTTSGSVAASGAAGGDPVQGKTLFEKRCGGCHSLDSDKEGPRLRNVYGRKAGSVPSFKYSDSLKAATHTWDATSLNRWLTDTEAVAPDNNMDFHVPSADERADIIDYLRVTAGK